MTIVDAGPQRERRARTGRFQFSLATALVVVTGVCVALSLVLWHGTFGLMAAILLVGSGWSAAARRAGYRKLAYCLAASALGVMGHLVLTGLVSGRHFLEAGRLFDPLSVLWMSMSTTVAAVLIRPLRSLPELGGFAGVYLTAIIYSVFWGAFTLFSRAIALVGPQLPPPEGGFMSELMVGPVYGALLATMTLPVTWPTGMLFCVILRRIDPMPDA